MTDQISLDVIKVKEFFNAHPEIKIELLKEYNTSMALRIIIYHVFKEGAVGVKQEIILEDCVSSFDEFFYLVKRAVNNLTE